MNNQQLPNPGNESLDQQTEQPAELCATLMALIPAVSIGAADPDEQRFFMEHLADCPEAIQALAAATGLTTALLTAVPPQSPPAQLEQRLVERLHVGTTSHTLVRGFLWWLRGWRSATVSVAAAILLLLALNLYWLQQVSQLRTQYRELSEYTRWQAQQAETINVLLASERRQAIELPAAQADSNARAEIVWDPDMRVAILYAQSFPVLTADRVYQLWLTRNGVRRSGGMFTVDTDGTGMLIFPIDEPLDGLDSMGITPEPAGGSPGPTSPPVVRQRFEPA
jgi:anti-sigma-K factor RskA